MLTVHSYPLKHLTGIFLFNPHSAPVHEYQLIPLWQGLKLPSFRNVIQYVMGFPSLFKLCTGPCGLSWAFIAKPKKMGVTLLLFPRV